ncbi:hypothetical protein BKA66DRAFT_473419 [Pyrenochaeta sp. MPI-SDFR-AT-0127]|nr:hypothetical protein BKA66DRAFT_473419 [Pyrenochaeta sp. MPI-SDFR-AT-0127]
MQTTYNVSITDKASRSFLELDKYILANYPPTQRNRIRILTNYLHSSYGSWSHPDDAMYRYIHVVIDIPKGRLQTSEHKQDLLRKTIEACREYQGKKADDCEIEVRINEFNEEDVARFVPKRPWN